MLEDLTPPSPLRTCATKVLLNKLEKKDQEILIAALANEAWAAKALARELTNRGLKISDHSLLRHKRKECSC